MKDPRGQGHTQESLSLSLRLENSYQESCPTQLDCDMREKQVFKNNGLRMGTPGLNSHTYNDRRTSYYCIMLISQQTCPAIKKETSE